LASLDCTYAVSPILNFSGYSTVDSVRKTFDDWMCVRLDSFGPYRFLCIGRCVWNIEDEMYKLLTALSWCRC